MDHRPIGIFDSGVGGLTVAREVFRQLPGDAIRSTVVPTDRPRLVQGAIAFVRVVAPDALARLPARKGREWTPRTLQELGGLEGIEVAFFEQHFAAGTAPPRYRLHAPAVRAVLHALPLVHVCHTRRP